MKKCSRPESGSQATSSPWCGRFCLKWRRMWMNCQSISPSFSASNRAGESPATTQFAPTTLKLVLRAREENRSWQLDGIHGREAALVDGQTHRASRIDIQQRLLQRHVTKSTDERDIHLRLANGDVYVLSVSVTQLEEVIAADVGHEIAKGTVGGDHFAAQATLIEVGGHKIEPD